MLIQLSYFRKAALAFLSLLGLALSMTPPAVAQGDLAAALKKKYRLTEINMQGVAANPEIED